MEFGSSVDGCLKVLRLWRNEITIRSWLPYIDFNLDSAYWYIAGLQPWPAFNAFGYPETRVCNWLIFSACEIAKVSMVAEKRPSKSNQAEGSPWKTGGWLFTSSDVTVGMMRKRWRWNVGWKARSCCGRCQGIVRVTTTRRGRTICF